MYPRIIIMHIVNALSIQGSHLTQVSRFDHENLAKMYDQMCAKVRMLQHEKDTLQDREGHYLDELKRYVVNIAL